MEDITSKVNVKQELLCRTICHCCLNVERTLTPLVEDLELFFYFSGSQHNLMDPEGIFVCWECAAILKKIRNFQNQIQMSQALLQDYFFRKQEPKFEPRLVPTWAPSSGRIVRIRAGAFSSSRTLNVEAFSPHHEPGDPVEASSKANRKVPPLTSFTQLRRVATDNTVFIIHEENVNTPMEIEIEQQMETEKADDKKDVITSEVGIEALKELGALIDEKEIKCEEYSDNEPSHDYQSDTSIKKEKVKMKKEKNDKKEKLEKVTGLKAIQRRWRHLGIITKNPDLNRNNFLHIFEDRVMKESDIENLGVAFAKRKPRHKTYPACQTCNKFFFSQIDYHRHKTFCHILKEGGPFECLSCDYEGTNAAALRTHWEEHNAAAYCKICDTIAKLYNQQKTHAETHKYLYDCKLCPAKTFIIYKDFIDHLKYFHKRVTCDYCKKTYITKANYMNGKNGINWLKSSLINHIRKNHQRFYCKLCDKEYTKYRSYYGHCTMNHPELIRKNKSKSSKELSYCVECNKHYGTHAKYLRHLNSSNRHNERKIFTCPEPDCGKEFSRKLYMNNHHKLFHKKQTKHLCNLCGKYLSTAYAMRQHMMGVHMKIREPKNKVCELCGRAFSTNNVLKRHMRTHTGERPYKCSFCTAAFTQRTPLVSHTRTQHKHILNR